ncbi:MAG: hypothetical protein ACREQJ_01640, partial [Candidatus Binatia bacterium]
MLELALAMTSLTLLLDPKTAWQVRAASSVLCSAALLHRPLLRRPELWIVLAGVLGWMNLGSWYAIDNHKYLLNYWLLALALGLTLSEPRRAIAFNARVLIGLAFLLATIQKIAAPDFLNGDFLGVSMLVDRRFQPLGEWLGGLSPGAFDANFRGLQSLVRFDSQLTVVPLESA